MTKAGGVATTKQQGFAMTKAAREATKGGKEGTTNVRTLYTHS
jgi:hypothetical protein